MVRDAMPDPLSEVFRPRCRTTPHPGRHSRPLSKPPRHSQQRALARSGMADHDTEIAPIRDMRERLGLLAGKDEAARHARSSVACLSVPFTSWRSRSAMEFGGPVQALFRLDHGAGGEAILAANVLAEFDQIGRPAHRAHDLVKLVDIAVPMRELRQIATR